MTDSANTLNRKQQPNATGGIGGGNCLIDNHLDFNSHRCATAFAGRHDGHDAAARPRISLPCGSCEDALPRRLGRSFLDFPPHVREIADWEYACFTDLVELSVPEWVERLGSHAFARCEALFDVCLPSGLKRIEEGTFEGCGSLQYLELPERLEEIGPCAFRYCHALSSLRLPSTLGKIGEEAFFGCCLERVDCLAPTPPECGADAFTDLQVYATTLRVPFDSLPSYRRHPAWGRFQDIEPLD